jgi:hypothetical protein
MGHDGRRRWLDGVRTGLVSFVTCDGLMLGCERKIGSVGVLLLFVWEDIPPWEKSRLSRISLG